MSKKNDQTRINDQIRSSTVRVVSEDGQQLGIMPITQALQIAENKGLDLVEVAPNANPPVCRIMDYGKYKYEQSKKEKSHKKKQAATQVKEIRLRPKIEEHDYEFKLKHARKFLEGGHKVKATVLFRGREMAHQEFGHALIKRFIQDLEDVAKVAREPTMEGRQIVVYLVKK
ncbi:MAG: translation initiation factor IF-3 [candidate division KSB1 bacterium]|nr:translation initiation factor IF-3 [candidate division KSB1 bacterium]MDQ7062705.1 translation initiation factor IF-3 [candidate division KSB1 bacterium]